MVDNAIADIFLLMGSVFKMLTGNPLFLLLIGIIVVSFVVGIVTMVFSRRRGRSRR